MLCRYIVAAWGEKEWMKHKYEHVLISQPKSVIIWEGTKDKEMLGRKHSKRILSSNDFHHLVWWSDLKLLSTFFYEAIMLHHAHAPQCLHLSLHKCTIHSPCTFLLSLQPTRAPRARPYDHNFWHNCFKCDFIRYEGMNVPSVLVQVF